MFSVAALKLPGSVQRVGWSLAALALLASPMALQAKTVTSVPSVVGKAINHGPIDPAADIRFTVRLAVPNQAAFDKKVADLYNPESPSFHQWLSAEDLHAYAPSDLAVKTVKEELAKQGLSVVEDGRDNFSIAVHGPAQAVETALGTRLGTFERNGKIFYANTTEAKLGGESEKYVDSIVGLNNVGMKPMFSQVKNAKTGKILTPVPLAKIKDASNGLSSFFTNQCFDTPTTLTFGSLLAPPVGVYFGNIYAGDGLVCGWTSSQMQSAYGLPAIYKEGIKGKGETIVIVDAYGSSTLAADASTFNTVMGLPQLTSSNFKTIYPSGQPFDPELGVELGWNLETTLDVEWSHSIAPEAKIVLLVAPAQDEQDLQYAIEYAAKHKLGSVVSNSYGFPEVEEGPESLKAWNQVAEMGAAVGISVNASTGDGGDLGLGSPVGALSAPSDSPYATAVGGTSLEVPNGAGASHETAWGNNQTEIGYPDPNTGAADAQDPPYNAGNVDGGGGGESIFFAKPAYEKKLTGSGRLAPDVAMEADPYTGAILIYTDPVEGQVAGSIGGTSLSCPMFSAYWALASQKAGHWLGQAAPILSKLPSSALNDIVPTSSAADVTGTVIDSSGATFYSAAALAAPLEGTTKFFSAVWPIQGFFEDLTFGTDTSLGTAVGWDDATGYGTPKGLGFILAAGK